MIDPYFESKDLETQQFRFKKRNKSQCESNNNRTINESYDDGQKIKKLPSIPKFNKNIGSKIPLIRESTKLQNIQSEHQEMPII